MLGKGLGVGGGGGRMQRHKFTLRHMKRLNKIESPIFFSFCVFLVSKGNLITKTHLFKYIENFSSKKLKIFRYKNCDIFHISARNIDCGYSLEPPRRGGSNEYPQSMF